MPRQAPKTGKASALVVVGLAVLVMGGLLAFWPSEPLDYSAPKLALIAAGLALAWLGTPRAAATVLDVPMLVLALAALASTFSSVDIPLSVLGDYTQPVYGLVELALYVCAFYLGASLAPREVQRGARLIVLGAAAMGALCLLQQAGIGPRIVDRATAASGSPVAAGACLAMALPLALSEAAASSALGGFAVPLIALGLALTKTRSAWLAAAVGAGVFVAGSGKLRSRGARIAAMLAVAALIASVLAVSAMHAQSDAIRVAIWRTAIAAFRRRPWLGYGPDSFSVALRLNKSLDFLAAVRWAGAVGAEAHNDLLQIAVTMGLTGLAAYVAVQGAWLAAVWPRRAADPRRWSAVVGALCAAASVAKLNPLPNEAVVLGALLAGTLAGETETPARRASVPRASAAVLALVFGSFWLADISFGRANRAVDAGHLPAAREAIDTALTLTPWRLEYETSSGEIAIAQAKAAASPGKIKEWTQVLLAGTGRAAKRHQGNPQAHALYGSAQIFASSVLGPALLTDAKTEMELASAMDPTDPYPIQRRLMIAQLLDDRAGLEKASSELARIQEIAPITPADPVPPKK